MTEDPYTFLPYPHQDDIDGPTKQQGYPYVQWIPTWDKHRHPAATFVAAKPDDVFYDLGCGDGRMVIEIARRYGCHCIGVDAKKPLIEIATQNAQHHGYSHLTHFQWDNIFETDFSNATIVYLFLYSHIVNALVPYLNAQPGLRVITNSYHPTIGWQTKNPTPRAVPPRRTGESISPLFHSTFHEYITPIGRGTQ